MQLIYQELAGHEHKAEMEGLDTEVITIATTFPF
jgi:hypothetical protein